MDEGDASMHWRIVQNRKAQLSSNQLQDLAGRTQDDRLIRSLIDHRYAELNEEQRHRLMGLEPQWESAILLIGGGQAGAEELRRFFTPARAVHRSWALDRLKYAPPGPGNVALVDVVLDLGSAAERSQLAPHLALTEVQVRRLLQDSDARVLAHVLRRKNLKVPPDLLQAGLANPRAAIRQAFEHWSKTQGAGHGNN